MQLPVSETQAAIPGSRSEESRIGPHPFSRKLDSILNAWIAYELLTEQHVAPEGHPNGVS
jgi:hypothetical protein